MTPLQRKETSNVLLSKHGIPVSESLPLIEDEVGVSLRSTEELLHRLIALWAVTGSAHLPEVDFFRTYVRDAQLEGWLSRREHRFLFSEDPAQQERVHFGWQLEPLFFLSWCGGLIPTISLPFQQSDMSSVLGLFPLQSSPTLDRLKAALSLRPTPEVLNWADLLYRAHWAVRESQLRGRGSPARLVPGAVMEWHKAANWMTGYEEEDDWDDVATDT
jgi:hypothetical protein